MSISNCPKCLQQVTIPDGLEQNAQVRCPVCDAEYPLSDLPEMEGFPDVTQPSPELVPHMRKLASGVGAALIVKPLASEYPGGRLMREGGTTFFLWSNL